VKYDRLLNVQDARLSNPGRVEADEQANHGPALLPSTRSKNSAGKKAVSNGGSFKTKTAGNFADSAPRILFENHSLSKD